MMTQKDEIDREKHLSMVLVEFIEGIGRVADRLSLPPYFENMEGVSEEYAANPGDMTVSTRRAVYNKLPLHVKIETLIMYMIKAVFKKDYFDKVEAKNTKFHWAQKIAEKKTKFVAVDARYSQKIKVPTDIDIKITDDNNEDDD